MYLLVFRNIFHECGKFCYFSFHSTRDPHKRQQHVQLTSMVWLVLLTWIVLYITQVYQGEIPSSREVHRRCRISHMWKILNSSVNGAFPCDKMKAKKYHTFRTVPKSKWKIIETWPLTLWVWIPTQPIKLLILWLFWYLNLSLKDSVKMNLKCNCWNLKIDMWRDLMSI
jgi:hypothetical protein